MTPSVHFASVGASYAAAAGLTVYTTASELRGTPGAPEPIASHGHFYSDAELADLAERAGLRAVAVTREAGGQLLTGRA